MLSIFPSVAKLHESLEQAQADLAAAQEELALLRAKNATTLQAASEEMQRLRNLLKASTEEAAVFRAEVTGTMLALREVKGQLAGARGRSMRKEKAQKKFETIQSN
jgi:multidrug resistance efflux pump